MKNRVVEMHVILEKSICEELIHLLFLDHFKVKLSKRRLFTLIADEGHVFKLLFISRYIENDWSVVSFLNCCQTKEIKPRTCFLRYYEFLRK